MNSVFLQMNSLITCASFLWLLEVVSSTITTPPQNAAGANTFSLQCGSDSSSSSSVFWKYNGTTISNGAQITSGYGSDFQIKSPASNVYELNCIATNCSIYAGNYQCSDSSGVMGVQVVVLDSTPQCSSSGTTFSPGDPVTMTCSVYYTGEWAPVMTWTFSRAINIAYNVNNVSTNNYVSSTLTMDATTALAGVIVSGVTFFNQPAPGSVATPLYATNVIKYEYQWDADTIVILEENGLSVGAIIGIVIGCLVLLAAIIFLIVCLAIRHRKKEDPPGETKSDPPASIYDDLDNPPKVILSMLSRPVNMDMSTFLPQADRGEEFLTFTANQMPGFDKSSLHHDNMPDVLENAHLNYAQLDWSPEFGSSQSTTGPTPMYPYMGGSGESGEERGSSRNQVRMSPDISYMIDAGSTGRFTPSSSTYSEYQTVPIGSLDTLV